MHPRTVLGLACTAALALSVSCTAPPFEVLHLDPAGPLSVAVGEVVDFTASPAPDGVAWSVEGVVGGSAATGTITATGTFTAPDRVPNDPVVAVGATDAVNAARTATADVTITAAGTMYVLDDDVVYVYGDVATVDGDVAPDRSFTLEGLAASDEFYDLIVVPALDVAFVTIDVGLPGAPTVVRVPDVSTASGVLTTFTSFDAGGYVGPSGVAYDEARDVLYVAVEDALLAYEDARTAPAGTAPDRVVAGADYAAFFVGGDVRIRLDGASDRLFASAPTGRIGVFDAASTLDGDVGPDRTIAIDVADLEYLWGLAYDAGRDELYVGDQRQGTAIYVIADASTAVGTVAPDRTLGGATHPLTDPSQVAYDAANDRLAVVLTSDPQGFALFDEVSTLDGDVAPDRLVSGPSLPLAYSFGGFLDPSQ